MVNLIVAMDKNGLIGKENGLPWNFPEDLAYFKSKTENKVVVMGSKTFDSIGKPLPNRVNMVVTRNPEDYVGISGIVVIEDFVGLFNTITGEQEIYIIGGAQIYKLAEPYVDMMYVTRIDGEFEGDVYFPEFDWEDFEIIYSKQSEDGILTFETYARKT